MTKQTKITLTELMARKEQMLEGKKTKKTQELYVNSLDGTITVETPDKVLVSEAVGMDNGDEHLVYQCVKEPNLKDANLQKEFGCVEPMEIVNKIFDPGEVPQIAQQIMKLAGYSDSVKVVEDLKN